MMEARPPVVPTYFHSLDAFRGIAAIIVVLFHWQMFFYPNDVFIPRGERNITMPLYPVLSIFYTHGMVSVDIFFQLSGFIFFWLYADSIAKGKTDFRKFSIYRISRLYPLHIVTLIAVGILQAIMLRRMGHYFVIQYNDAYHFFLNLFFMQNWGLEVGPSFNAPSWSISVEVFIYLLFFLICKMKWHTNKALLILLIPAGALTQHFSLLIGKGVFSFFLGAMLYYVYVYLLQQQKARQYFRVLAPLTLALWVLVVVFYYYPFIEQAWIHNIGRFRPGLTEEQSTAAYGTVRNLVFRVTVAPCTILSLVLWETIRGQLHSRWSMLGNCSYAIYLLHFPLQITTVLIMQQLHLDRRLLLLPWVMIAFISVVVLLAGLVYYYFEQPAQDKIRQATLSRKGMLAS
ncbi:acyltransferase family protein [Chitinophaga qingshengii]|uniref:Acyltransferase n=1 Tax=Chitinophaga qingshengii TaxID=1569794 RepID=A0ABR7TG70_9BACT|nr:acyltransferase [Chitinophaga qingshengii]MBC9929408.1 acyltransferase [Chitinophaga qingshengii]